MSDAYWNHNTAYHPWILRRAAGRASVLDVGCGDGLLLERLSPVCSRVTGIDPDPDAADRARERTADLPNVRVLRDDFLTAPLPPASFDLVIFSASLHHMDREAALRKARDLLSPGGLLLVVGLAKPKGLVDYLTEILRVIPAAVGSALRGESDPGVPIREPELSLRELRKIVKALLPGAAIRRGLYYRYLLRWQKRRTEKHLCGKL